MKSISVVIPSYNHQAFIADAIRSVAAQDMPDLELVIIDDGSTDESVERICRELENISIGRVVFKQQKNRGAHDAIMQGIRESSGDIIAILNSDDRFATDRLERMAPYFEGRDEFLAFSMVRVIGASGAVLPDSHPTSRGYRHALYEATRCPTVGFGLLRNNFSVTSGNFVFTRGLYERIGGFSAHRLAHDWDFLLRSMVHVEPIFVPEHLMDYRSHETNSIHELGDLAEQEGSEILNRFLDLCAKGTDNHLAPCPENWPLYFDLFASRYAPWFGGPSIRSWIGDAIEIDSVDPAGRLDWHSWADAIDFETVDDCAYVVAGGTDSAAPDALALAREVLVSEAHPLAHESGDGTEALRALFERRAHAMARVQCEPWKSPLSGAVRGLEAKAGSVLPSASPGSPRVKWTRMRRHARRMRTLAGRFLRALGLRRNGDVIRLINRTGLFDAEYYIAAGELGRLTKSRALRHFLSVGAKQGLDPHPLFDTSYYLEMNPDVARAGSNPLVHYIAYGAWEGRDPHPLFSSQFYFQNNPDVAATKANPLAHYAKHGAFEGREPHPRFDAQFYRDHSPGPIPEDMSPLAHYVLVGAEKDVPISRAQEDLARLNPVDRATSEKRCARELGPRHEALRRLRFSGFFDADYYQQHVYSHKEVVDPFRHFIEIGSLEGLPFCHPRALAERMSRSDSRGVARPELAYLRGGRAKHAERDACVDLFVSSEGSPLYQEMAVLLAEGFRDIGARARIGDETHEPDGRATNSLIFAPHEFFTLGRGAARFEDGLISRSHLFMAELPGSSYFSRGVWFAQRAHGVLDANPASAYMWSEMGFRARFLPLGLVRDSIDEGPACRESILRGALGRDLWDAPPPRNDCFEDRPIDVFFEGESSSRRRQFFAKESAFFASLRCALFMPVPNLAPSSGPESALNRREAAVLARQAKVHLVLHREEVPHFDWYRGIVRGMGHGALLVAEKGLALPGLIAGRHYFESEASKMPELLHWLLETPGGRAEAEVVRLRGLETLAEHFALPDILHRFLQDTDDTQGQAPEATASERAVS